MFCGQWAVGSGQISNHTRHFGKSLDLRKKSLDLLEKCLVDSGQWVVDRFQITRVILENHLISL
jgi:hypothetical protein